MSRLHRIASAETNVSIHIDNLTAQSGVTRFTEINPNWTYSKDENLKAGDEELHKFDFLLTEVKNKYSPEMRFLQQTHEKIELIECFSNIGVHYTSLLPIKIRTKPCIMILKRKPNAVLLKMFFDADEPDELFGSEDAADVSGGLIDSELENYQEAEDEEEEQEEPPKVLKRKRLRASATPKSKIKEIIEADRLEALLNLEEMDYLSKEANSAEQEEDTEDGEGNPEENDENDEENEGSLEASQETQDDHDNDGSLKDIGSSGIKGNIKRIISQEKTKQLIDELKQLDLSAFCDLRQMDTKECLKKILDESTE